MSPVRAHDLWPGYACPFAGLPEPGGACPLHDTDTVVTVGPDYGDAS